MVDARAKSPPSKLRIRSGKMGAMMPKERKSNPTITRIKVKAARLGAFSGSEEDGGKDTGSPEEKIVAYSEEFHTELLDKRNMGGKTVSPTRCRGAWGFAVQIAGEVRLAIA